jgi:hypothetical protein
MTAAIRAASGLRLLIYKRRSSEVLPCSRLRQRGKQLGNRRLLIGFLRNGSLAQYQSSAGGKGGNQVQRGGIDPADTNASAKHNLPSVSMNTSMKSEQQPK